MSGPCPICRRPVDSEAPHRPFCSARCKNVDLGRWLNEEYRISRPLSGDEVEAPPSDQAREQEEVD